jgi:hypothetical protein
MESKTEPKSMKTTPLPYAGTVANQISCVKISRIKRELHASPRHEIAGSLAKFIGITIAKASSMKTIIRNLFAALVLGAVSLHVHAQGLVIDQESYNGPIDPQAIGVDGLYLTDQNIGETFEQSFIPSLSAIDYVALEFESANVPVTVKLNLYEGTPTTINPTLIGTTSTVTMPSGFNNNQLGFAGVQDFYFPTPITLTPGGDYYFVPELLSGGVNWSYVTMIDLYTYPNGQLTVNGYPYINSTDMWFQEGVLAVPEPTTLALIGFTCLLLLAFKFRHHFKPPVLMFATVLFTLSVVSVNAAGDSVVQATASEAGLTEVSPPSTGTFYVATINTNSGLIMLPPYPILPTNMLDLPTFLITNNIFLVDFTKGEVSASSETLSKDAAASEVAAQSQTVESLIEMVETPPIPNGGPEGTNGNPAVHPNNLPPVSDTTNIWLLATNDINGSSLDMTLMNGTGNNVQLLSTTNLLLKTNWCLGPILQGANVNYNNVFSPVPYTNTMTFFRVHEANPVLEIAGIQNAIEPTNSTSGQNGYFYIQNDSYDTTNDITVYFTLSGTGQNGIDYSNVPGSVVLSNSLGYAYINIDPLANGIEPNKTIILTINQNTNYLIQPGYDSITNSIQANPQVYPILNGDNIAPCPNATTPVYPQIQNPGNLTLVYTVLSLPTHGTLDTNTISSGYFNYTTSGCFEGQDSFTNKVTGNGQYTAGPVTVILDVKDQMSSSPLLVQTCRGTPVVFTLNVNNQCNETLSNYTLISTPPNGTLSNWPNTLTFTFYPDGTNFTGTNTFNYIANSDCGADSTTNSVSIIIGDAGVYPNGQNFVIATNQPLPITLTATDNGATGDTCTTDTDYYTYTITTPPTHGTITNFSGANLTYIPAHDFEGEDTFQFIASDGVLSNSPATINIYVVGSLSLSTSCDPFGTAVQLNWTMDTNVYNMWQEESLDMNDFLLSRSTNPDGPFTPVATITDMNETNVYYDTNDITVGQTYYYVVNFQSSESYILYTSPTSNVAEASSQMPNDLIPANAFWNVITNVPYNTNVVRLQAPFSGEYPGQYPGFSYPYPNSTWTYGTMMTNSTTMVIPTNTPFSQVQYSIAIDNYSWLYVNGILVSTNSDDEPGGLAFWSSFVPFPDNTLHYGTNNIVVGILDTGGINYFDMVVTTNSCGW